MASTAKMTTKYGLNVAVINGRNVFVKRITSINRDRPGHFIGIANESLFHIEGGRPAGGSSRDWLVAWNGIWDGYIRATSLRDAVRLIENA